jgi:3-deoxy-manno-octulosonate cytidylyltransferase (CMP-KDO synthetase)
MRRALAIIPARLASTRLPRKMLLEAAGLPLVVHTARNVASSGAFARVVVATDAAEIAQAVRAHGHEALLTRADHPSGTDRIHEAWQQLSAAGEQAELIVNVQGDEPELEPADLARLAAVFDEAGADFGLATLALPLSDPASIESPSIVKVVFDRRGRALYFSRAAIPAAGHGTETEREPKKIVHHRHIGVYAFDPAALGRFCSLPRGDYEMRESLEQLRWLEAGYGLRVVLATRAPVGIDTREDFERFAERAARQRTGDPTTI